MEFKKVFSTFLIFELLSCNISIAQESWVFTKDPVTQAPIYSIQRNSDDYIEYNSDYYNANYYNSDGEYYYEQVPTYEQQAVIVQEKQSFSDKHPVLTAVGVGALLIGAVTAGVLCSDAHPHGRPPHHPPYPHRR